MRNNAVSHSGFTFRFGQLVKVKPPHPEAGSGGTVTNAWKFVDGREEVFVAVPGCVERFAAEELQSQSDD